MTELEKEFYPLGLIRITPLSTVPLFTIGLYEVLEANIHNNMVRISMNGRLEDVLIGGGYLTIKTEWVYKP